jgi:HAE1 family hydrophobic/amphiphilic exporter-1
MRISHFFIERPVFAAVVAILITLVGAIAFPNLPIAQYPEIAPPTVTVSATYPGASAETLADTVATPIEQQINGVENMLYLSSQSTGDGHLTITVTFKLGTDPNQAQVLVENRVAAATPLLPPEVNAAGVVVRKSTTDFLLSVHVYSPDGSLDQQYIANYVGLHVRDSLLRLPGVGDIASRAARDYAMRIWIDPDRAAERNLTVDDIVAALKAQNVQVAAGAIGQPPGASLNSAYQLNVEALGRLSTPNQFADIVVKTDPQGRITRIGDVARVELGAPDYSTNAYIGVDGVLHNGVGMGVLQQPGSNAPATAKAVIAQMEKLKQDFPPGLAYKIIYNPTDYVRASILEVAKTLFIAVGLVVLVVLAFLQSWRAAIIPIIAIPVSLMGALAALSAFHFSLNNLSLFGLVLSIGIVVDDAIVVVENVDRHLRAGMAPREAAHRTMDEVGGALVGIALVLMAVFIPTAFISGITGQFYRQFALTIAASTLISLVVSLTLSPALAAMLMRPESAGHVARGGLAGLGARFNAAFDRLAGGYSRLIRRVLRMTAMMLVVYAGLVALAGLDLTATPRGFIPAQDQGNLIVAMTLPPGASLARTDALAREAGRRLMESPETAAISTSVGVDATVGVTASNAAQMYVVLKPFKERARLGKSLRDIIAEFNARLAPVTGADIKIIEPPAVRGLGTTGGFKLIVEDQGGHGAKALADVTRQLAAAASKSPAIGSAFVTFNTATPRLYADIDRVKAEVLGVPASAVFSTLQTYLGSTFINDFNLFGHTYQVLAQADAPFRDDESRLTELKTRSTSGAMVPLGSLVNLRHTTGPYRVLRYNLFPAAEIQGQAAPGYSSGQALHTLQALAKATLPPGYGYEWTELAYQEQLAGNTGILIFGAAVVFVFLLLAALYESVTLPLAVIFIVPMCLLAAMAGINLRGLDDNILTQIGLVVLVGLASKNAILIVEFARQGEVEHGLGRAEAAMEAGRTRLRPILMTSFSFILGVAPLAFASGAGAEMRQALGVAVFFGMIGVTAFGLLFTPVFFLVFRRLSDHLPKPTPRRAPEPAE